MTVHERLNRWWHGHARAATAMPSKPGRVRGVVDHVIILDGTLSTLNPGMETNAGLLFRLLKEGGVSAQRTIYYEPGLQWEGWRYALHVAQGKGLSRQIRRAYGWLASHYRPGDRIFLFGYSRGAYAVRSLAGVIDQVGLIKREHATERGVLLAWRHYRTGPTKTTAQAFARRFCHATAPIEMVGVWDTVKALGLRLPILWMLTDKRNAFHNPHLGSGVKHGFHALARDETRAVFEPVLWQSPQGWRGNVEQVWFRGAHGDIGGQIGDFAAARPLANIPLVWMLDRAETLGLTLPDGWRSRFPCDPEAPMVGTWRGFGKCFLLRRRRRIGVDPSERLHSSVPDAPPRWRFALPSRR
ncbi:MAG: DUF2235 domain-containing protein [Paracoccaceae bacterium]